ncbi:MAG: EutN/CcmL family microcompartment protein [Anaerolineae bacterium]
MPEALTGGKSPDGERLVAIDMLGAGVTEPCCLCGAGRPGLSRFPAPVDATVVGIVDTVDKRLMGIWRAAAIKGQTSLLGAVPKDTLRIEFTARWMKPPQPWGWPVP